MYAAWVFFASARWADRRIGWRQQVRIIRRHPRWFWNWLQAAVVRFITHSPAAHVAIGDGRRVLTLSPKGCAIHEHMSFTCRFPTLLEVWLVPTDRPINMERHTSRRASRFLYGDNCVRLTRDILADAGVRIKARTPEGMRREFARSGYAKVEFEQLD